MFKRFINEREFIITAYQRGSIKLFKDGSLGARTALMSAPYHDDKSTKGVESISNKLWIKYVLVLQKNRLPVAYSLHRR